jgi:hypothetical protein
MTVMAIFGLIMKIFVIGVDPPSEDKGFIQNSLVGALRPTNIPEEIVKLEKATTDLEQSNREVKYLKTELTSRGSIIEREKTRKDKIVSVINNNMWGKLKGKGLVIYEACVANGVHPFLQASVIIHETGAGTSKAVQNQNNVGGIMNENDKLKTFKTVDDSIWKMAEIMRKYYIEKNLTALDQFGHKYCPVGAANDPTGLNKYWVPAVSKVYIKMLNESGGIIW